MNDFCCEEGKQFTGGVCWEHLNPDVKFVHLAESRLQETIDDPSVLIDEKEFYKKAMKTKLP